MEQGMLQINTSLSVTLMQYTPCNNYQTSTITTKTVGMLVYINTTISIFMLDIISRHEGDIFYYRCYSLKKSRNKALCIYACAATI